MPRAVLYYRISLDATGEREGVGEQREDLHALAERRGWEVVAELEDNDRSASRGARPAWEELLTLISSGEVDVVAAKSVDRLYRRPQDLERLVSVIESAPRLVEISTIYSGELDLNTAAGRMVARMLGAVARHEVEAMSERIRRSLAGEATAGRTPRGVPPYGYKAEMVDGVRRFLPDESTAPVVRRMYEMAAAGSTPHGIAKALNEDGVTPLRTGAWSSQTVRRVLERHGNAGVRTHDGVVVGPASWEPLVTPELYAQATSVMGERTQSRGRASHYPWSGGFLVCGTCGGGVSGGPTRAGRRRYNCRRGHVSINEAALEDALRHFAITVALPALQSLLEAHSEPPAPSDAHREVSEVARLRREAAELFAAGVIDAGQLHTISQALNERQRSAEATMRGETAQPLDELAHEALDDGSAWWESASSDQRRLVVGAVADRVEVHPSSRSPRVRVVPLEGPGDLSLPVTSLVRPAGRQPVTELV